MSEILDDFAWAMSRPTLHSTINANIWRFKQAKKAGLELFLGKAFQWKDNVGKLLPAWGIKWKGTVDWDLQSIIKDDRSRIFRFMDPEFNITEEAAQLRLVRANKVIDECLTEICARNRYTAAILDKCDILDISPHVLYEKAWEEAKVLAQREQDLYEAAFSKRNIEKRNRGLQLYFRVHTRTMYSLIFTKNS
jgi:hypothetical protein